MDKGGVLEDLAGDEHCAEDVGDDVPLAHAPGGDLPQGRAAAVALAVLCSVDAELAPDREITRISVLAVAKGMLSIAVRSPTARARMVKYIANRPKNMSSLESQTIVPTETMFGRVTGP